MMKVASKILRIVEIVSVERGSRYWISSCLLCIGIAIWFESSFNCWVRYGHEKRKLDLGQSLSLMESSQRNGSKKKIDSKPQMPLESKDFEPSPEATTARTAGLFFNNVSSSSSKSTYQSTTAVGTKWQRKLSIYLGKVFLGPQLSAEHTKIFMQSIEWSQSCLLTKGFSF